MDLKVFVFGAWAAVINLSVDGGAPVLDVGELLAMVPAIDVVTEGYAHV